MSAPTKTYRVYCYDAVHKIVSVDLIEAAGDEEALEQARTQGFGSRCEIWEGRRMVAQLGGEARQA